MSETGTRLLEIDPQAPATPAAGDSVYLVQGGVSRRTTADRIAALATKTTVGLGNVSNTAPANLPISTAVQAALDGKATAGPIGASGLTMTAGILGQIGTGAPQVYGLGAGLSIVNGVLTVSASGSGTVTSVGLSVPTGFAVAGSPITTSGAFAVTFAAGYSLPTTANQANWSTAYAERNQWDGGSTGLNAVTGRASLQLGTAAQAATTDFATAAQGTLAATAVQPAGLTSYVQTGDSRLSDSREWSAATVAQATAEAGTSTTRAAYNPLRVFQSIAAYVTANFSAVGQALATAANAAAARTTLELGNSATRNIGATAGTVAAGDDSRLSDARTPTAHNQAASTITGLATVATSGAYSDLTGRPTLFDPASPGAIGGATAAAGSFTALSAGSSLLLPDTAVGTPVAGHVYRVADQLRYRDSNTTEQVVLYGGGNLANLANAATARGNLSAAGSGPIGASGLTMTAGILGQTGTGAPQVYGLLGLAFSGASLATLADMVIPLSDPASALTASTTVPKETIPYLPRATTFTDLPIWAVATAPTGAALQFDIQVGGTSIYLPASGGTYPTIAAGSTNSTASPGTFTTAFAAAPTIAVGSVVTFFVRQIGSTVAGAGLKVALLTRRAG